MPIPSIRQTTSSSLHFGGPRTEFGDFDENSYRYLNEIFNLPNLKEISLYHPVVCELTISEIVEIIRKNPYPQLTKFSILCYHQAVPKNRCWFAFKNYFG